MKEKNVTLFFFVIIYVSVFASSWLFGRFERNQGMQYVQLGVMSPSDELLPKYNYITQLAQDEINAYCNQSSLNYKFKCNITNAASNPENAIIITKNYHEEGVNLARAVIIKCRARGRESKLFHKEV